MPKSKNNIQLVITEDSDEKKVDWNDPESKKEYSKRDYTKKIYLSGDKKDLRKSFPKWTMVA